MIDRILPPSILLMHALDLAGLASVFAANARSLLACGELPSSRALQEYWLCCRFLHESWTHRLAEHRQEIQRGGTSHRLRRWYAIQPLIQEVFLIEPLTRMVAYLSKLLDERHEDGAALDSWSIAANALAIQTETRHRCLHLVVFGPGLPVDMAVQLNRLRRCVEEFSDRLLASLPHVADVEPFCFDAPSVKECQRTLIRSHDERTTQASVRLLDYWLQRHAAFDLDGRSINPRLNRRTHQAVMGWLPASMFDAFGTSNTAGLRRLQWTGDESTGGSDDPAATLQPPLDLLSGQLTANMNLRHPAAKNRSPGQRW